MFHQPTDQTVNGSCQTSTSACNKSADGDALQLPTFSTAAKVRVIITFILCAVSAVCNLVVLWAASNGGKRKSHVRILIMNLTVADLLVTFIVMPVDAVWNITVQWQAGDVACRLLMFMKLVAMYSCAFVTVVISLDRQSAILNPLGISEAKRKSKIMLTVAWTMSVILSLPQVKQTRIKEAARDQVLQNLKTSLSQKRALDSSEDESRQRVHGVKRAKSKKVSRRVLLPLASSPSSDDATYIGSPQQHHVDRASDEELGFPSAQRMMFIFHNVTITVPENFTQCTTHGSFVQHWQETLYNMFTFVCLFLLPLVIMIFCYTRILVEMARSNLLSRDIHLRRSHNNIPKARMRTLKMSIVIVTSFIICWTPYYLLGLWYWLFPEKMEETVSHSLTHMLFIFGLFNACLDPITYGLFTVHLHQGLRRCCSGANTRTEVENNTCLVHMTRLSSHRQNASAGHNTDVEEGNDNSSLKSGSRPIIPISKI